MSWRRAALMIACVTGIAAAAAAQSQGAWDTWYTVADAAARNDTQQVAALLDAGDRDPDALESSTGRTALGYAVTFDNMQMAKLLLDHGAHVDWHDKLGNTALHYAAERGTTDFIRFLIAHKATVDAVNHQGQTPLMVAAEQGNAAAARLLVASGADPRKEDFTGRDAFGWAEGKPAVQQVLAEKPRG
jgi:uncharacterized protein